MRPAYMTATVSAISAATPRSWVTKIIPMPSSRRRAAHAGMPAQGLADLLADGIDRVERRHRLLEDHRDQAAAQRAQLARRHGQHIRAADPHIALDPRLARQEPQ